MKSQEQKPTRKTQFVYFQLGLIVTLLAAIFFIEHKSVVKEEAQAKVEHKVRFVESNPVIAFKEEKHEKIQPKKEPVKKQPKKTEKFIINDKDLFPDVDQPTSNPVDTLSQQKVLDGLEKLVDDEISPINHLVVEEVPVFPGCEIYESKAERSTCFSSKISKLVQRKFNHSVAEDYGLSGQQRIYVTFTVNKEGKVVDVKASSQVDVLAQEAERVAKLLPDMKPGKQQGKNVPVSYSLPISFTVQ